MHTYVNSCMLLEGEIGLAQHQEGQKRMKLIQRYKHVHLMCAYVCVFVRALMRVNSRACCTCIHVYTCPPGTNTSRSCRRHISRRSATTSTIWFDPYCSTDASFIFIGGTHIETPATPQLLHASPRSVSRDHQASPAAKVMLKPVTLHQV